jgi:hypothetical protein
LDPAAVDLDRIEAALGWRPTGLTSVRRSATVYIPHTQTIDVEEGANMAAFGIRPPRRALMAFASVVIAVALAGCGNSAGTSPSASPSQVAAASASSAPSASVAASSAPSASTAASRGPDPAAGLKIDAPYSFVDLPPAMQQAFETQMASSLGAFGSSITYGFRQVQGGTGLTYLLVLAFPSGTMNASTFQGMVGGLSGSMGATLTTTTVDGVDVASGPSSSGGVAIFHIGDHALIVIAEKPADSLPVAKALISANQ